MDGNPLPDRRELTIIRLFDAPPALVYKCWTDAERLAMWWGPACFTNPVCRADPRPGGEIEIVMRAPDGSDYPMRGAFRELVPAERIVFTSCALGPGGEILIEGLTTVVLEAAGSGTRMTLHSEAKAVKPVALGMIAGMEAGWTQSIEKLAALIAGSA